MNAVVDQVLHLDNGHALPSYGTGGEKQPVLERKDTLRLDSLNRDAQKGVKRFIVAIIVSRVKGFCRTKRLGGLCFPRQGRAPLSRDLCGRFWIGPAFYPPA